MTNILVDTNILLDLLARREPFYQGAAKVFSLGDKQKIRLSVSALSIATVHYILTKSHKSAEVRNILRRLKILVNILSLNEKIIELALNDNAYVNFEDGLQYHTAIESSQDIILTRNQKDFKKSSIPVMSPDEYLTSRLH